MGQAGMTMGQTVKSVLAVLLMFSSVLVSRTAPSPLPSRLETYLSSVIKLSPTERRRLTDGAIVTKLLEADASKEIAVFGAIWMDAPIARYLEALNDIEHLETGIGYRSTKRIGTPPAIGDFAAMHLSEDDVRDLRKCRVGSCDMKLDVAAITRFRNEIDWREPNAGAAADALFRRVALDYVAAYLESGNQRLPAYRDKSHPIGTGDEFRSMVEGMKEFTPFMPEMRPYLLGFPKVVLPDSSSFLYWQDTTFGLKPTLRISHVTVREGKEETVVASRMLWASHYFWTAIELRMLVPDPARGAGFWFVTVSRSRIDGLSGFTGAFVRWRVRSQVQSAVTAGLQLTKQKVERPR